MDPGIRSIASRVLLSMVSADSSFEIALFSMGGVCRVVQPYTQIPSFRIGCELEGWQTENDTLGEPLPSSILTCILDASRDAGWPGPRFQRRGKEMEIRDI